MAFDLTSVDWSVRTTRQLPKAVDMTRLQLAWDEIAALSAAAGRSFATEDWSATEVRSAFPSLDDAALNRFEMLFQAIRTNFLTVEQDVAGKQDAGDYVTTAALTSQLGNFTNSNDLTSLLLGKADVSAVNSEVARLDTAIGNRPTSHEVAQDHYTKGQSDGRYRTQTWINDNLYLQTRVDSLLAGKSDSSHSHPDPDTQVYALRTYVDQAISTRIQDLFEGEGAQGLTTAIGDARYLLADESNFPAITSVGETGSDVTITGSQLRLVLAGAASQTLAEYIAANAGPGDLTQADADGRYYQLTATTFGRAADELTLQGSGINVDIGGTSVSLSDYISAEAPQAESGISQQSADARYLKLDQSTAQTVGSVTAAVSNAYVQNSWTHHLRAYGANSVNLAVGDVNHNTIISSLGTIRLSQSNRNNGAPETLAAFIESRHNAAASYGSFQHSIVPENSTSHSLGGNSNRWVNVYGHDAYFERINGTAVSSLGGSTDWDMVDDNIIPTTGENDRINIGQSGTVDGDGRFSGGPRFHDIFVDAVHAQRIGSYPGAHTIEFAVNTVTFDAPGTNDNVTINWANTLHQSPPFVLSNATDLPNVTSIGTPAKNVSDLLTAIPARLDNITHINDIPIASYQGGDGEVVATTWATIGNIPDGLTIRPATANTSSWGSSDHYFREGHFSTTVTSEVEPRSGHSTLQVGRDGGITINFVASTANFGNADLTNVTSINSHAIPTDGFGGGGDEWSDAVDSHILPATGNTNTYDIGGSSQTFRDGVFGRNVFAGSFRSQSFRPTATSGSAVGASSNNGAFAEGYIQTLRVRDLSALSGGDLELNSPHLEGTPVLTANMTAQNTPDIGTSSAALGTVYAGALNSDTVQVRTSSANATVGTSGTPFPQAHITSARLGIVKPPNATTALQIGDDAATPSIVQSTNRNHATARTNMHLSGFQWHGVMEPTPSEGTGGWFELGKLTDGDVANLPVRTGFFRKLAILPDNNRLMFPGDIDSDSSYPPGTLLVTRIRSSVNRSPGNLDYPEHLLEIGNDNSITDDATDRRQKFVGWWNQEQKGIRFGAASTAAQLQGVETGLQISGVVQMGSTGVTTTIDLNRDNVTYTNVPTEWTQTGGGGTSFDIGAIGTTAIQSGSTSTDVTLGGSNNRNINFADSVTVTGTLDLGSTGNGWRRVYTPSLRAGGTNVLAVGGAQTGNVNIGQGGSSPTTTSILGPAVMSSTLSVGGHLTPSSGGSYNIGGATNGYWDNSYITNSFTRSIQSGGANVDLDIGETTQNVLISAPLRVKTSIQGESSSHDLVIGGSNTQAVDFQSNVDFTGVTVTGLTGGGTPFTGGEISSSITRGSNTDVDIGTETQEFNEGFFNRISVDQIGKPGTNSFFIDILNGIRPGVGLDVTFGNQNRRFTGFFARNSYAGTIDAGNSAEDLTIGANDTAATGTRNVILGRTGQSLTINSDTIDFANNALTNVATINGHTIPDGGFGGGGGGGDWDFVIDADMTISTDNDSTFVVGSPTQRLNTLHSEILAATAVSGDSGSGITIAGRKPAQTGSAPISIGTTNRTSYTVLGRNGTEVRFWGNQTAGNTSRDLSIGESNTQTVKIGHSGNTTELNSGTLSINSDTINFNDGAITNLASINGTAVDDLGGSGGFTGGTVANATTFSSEVTLNSDVTLGANIDFVLDGTQTLGGFDATGTSPNRFNIVYTRFLLSGQLTSDIGIGTGQTRHVVIGGTGSDKEVRFQAIAKLPAGLDTNTINATSATADIEIGETAREIIAHSNFRPDDNESLGTSNKPWHDIVGRHIVSGSNTQDLTLGGTDNQKVVVDDTLQVTAANTLEVNTIISHGTDENLTVETTGTGKLKIEADVAGPDSGTIEVDHANIRETNRMIKIWEHIGAHPVGELSTPYTVDGETKTVAEMQTLFGDAQACTIKIGALQAGSTNKYFWSSETYFFDNDGLGGHFAGIADREVPFRSVGTDGVSATPVTIGNLNYVWDFINQTFTTQGGGAALGAGNRLEIWIRI